MPTTTLYRPYTTLTRLKTVLRWPSNDSTIDDWLKECINNASRYVEEKTHRDFWFHDHAASALTVQRSWRSGNSVLLPFPILTLTAVTVAGVVKQESDYEWENSTGTGAYGVVRFATDEEPEDEDPIVLTGTFGFALATQDAAITPPPLLPDSINRATALVAAAFSGEMKREIFTQTGGRETIGDQRIPGEAKDLLKPYTRAVL